MHGGPPTPEPLSDIHQQTHDTKSPSRRAPGTKSTSSRLERRAASPGPRGHASGLDPLHGYLKRIGEIPLLTAAREVELAEQLQAGTGLEQQRNGQWR